jgi:SAM-dependent methyltransferase
MKKPSTREKQYDIALQYRDQQGLQTLGLMTNQAWQDDPKRLAFTFARYKFVAKMFSGFDRVLEVGCADAFATRVVVQDVKQLTAVDFDPVFVSDARTRMSERWKFDVFAHDLLAGPVSGTFDGVYALDVLEHIRPADEHRFLSNMIASLAPHGVMIIGMPSLESKTMPDLRASLSKFFHNVFMFSMNDEVVHTGYHKMAHYLIALCCARR